jgi:hypothetical protein
LAVLPVFAGVKIKEQFVNLVCVKYNSPVPFKEITKSLFVLEPHLLISHVSLVWETTAKN